MPTPALPPAKIVVADDDHALLQTVTTILRAQGYEVVPVSESQTLLDVLQREQPDLLMLDIMMPKVDGLQLLKDIRASGRWRDLPVLMISSMPPEDGTIRSLGLGASDFVAKPFRMRELLARVEAQLRAANALRDARAEAAEQATEASVRDEMIDILHEITDAMAPEEIYHVLTRRVAKVLNVSRCSLVVARRGDRHGTVVVAAENPMVRNLHVQLERYPEILRALDTDEPVLVTDVRTDPLYADVRRQWEHEGIPVSTRSVIAVPFGLQEEQSGVFFLRTVGDDAALTPQDVEFATKVVRTVVNALERSYALQSAETDKERFQWLATTDPLTGCLNRRALSEELEAELGRVRRYGLALSVLMIDLDHFKEVNDRFGHLVGDGVLRQMGEVLRREVRSVDTLARYGGEEFVIVLPETILEGALTFAERMRARIARHDFGGGETPLTITVSVGVASGRASDITDGDALIARADAALYRAKHEGRNLVRS